MNLTEYLQTLFEIRQIRDSEIENRMCGNDKITDAGFDELRCMWDVLVEMVLDEFGGEE